jgi:hypothetical protein
VLVDGAIVMTDALGRFDARVEQRRVAVVRVPVELSGNQTVVALDGRATAYAVDLQLAVPPPLD